MIIHSKGTKMYIDALLKHNTGKSLKQYKKMKKDLKKMKKAQIQASNERVQSAIDTIRNLYSIANLSPELISKTLNLDIDYVKIIIGENENYTK